MQNSSTGNFDAAFAPGAKQAGLARRARTAARWRNAELEFDFCVNPKASMLPDCPGEFSPRIAWSGPRHGPRDERACPYLPTLRAMLDHALVPQQPDAGLYYVDEEDARAWGAWFGARIGKWLRRLP